MFSTFPKAVTDLIERVKKSGYGVTQADADAVLKAVREGTLRDAKLTKPQQTLVSEVVAMQMEETFGNEAAIKRLVGEKPNLAKQILSRIKAFLQTFGKKSSKDPEAIQNLRRTEELFRKALQNAGVSYAVDELTRVNSENMHVSGENGAESVDEATSSEHKKSPAEGEVKYSKGRMENARRIAANMSETDRAEILRECSIEPIGVEIADGFDINFEQLEKNRKSVVEKALVEKLRKLGFLKSYKTDVVDVQFEFTGGGLRKSMNSQVSDYGGNLADLAKVVMNMQQLLDGAVLLEIHTDKAKGTPRENARLVQTYVLLSAFEEKSIITPVQFEIKQYVDDNNRLYLAVALAKIKTGVVGDTAPQNEGRTRLIPVSAISIPDLVKKINPRDENFFKYIPDEFLNEEQIQSKKRALEKDAKKYGRDISFSRKSAGGVVTISEGEMAKLHANYAGDKVFDKKSVSEALASIDAFKKLSPEIRRDFVDRIWKGYNQRLHQRGFEQFTEMMWEKLHATIMQEVAYDELGNMTEEQYAEAERVMDEQIVAALRQIVASGKPSIKAKLESATSTEGYRNQARFWRDEHARVVARNKLLGRVKFEVEKLANLKAGRYVNAANYKNNIFSKAITELVRMNWRGGMVRDAKIREHFAARKTFRTFLTKWGISDIIKPRKSIPLFLSIPNYTKCRYFVQWITKETKFPTTKTTAQNVTFCTCRHASKAARRVAKGKCALRA